MTTMQQMILIKALIAVIGVAGVYILTGLTGMFSLGQASFMAIGAYASGILVKLYKWPFELAIAAAVVIAVLIGLMVGLPTVRLRRDYISLITLGFGEAFTALLNKMTKFTGGASGFYGIPKKVTLDLVVWSVVVVLFLVIMFKNSKYGRQCIAIRSDELAAKAMGINVPKVKLIAFLTSVAMVAYSGCMYAFFITYVDPSLFGWKRSADWVIMVFFGGVNSLTGSVLSAFFLTSLPEFLRSMAQYRYIIYAVLVLLIINFRPTGLLGEFELSPKGIKSVINKVKSLIAGKGKTTAKGGSV